MPVDITNELLDQFGLDHTDTNREQLAVMAEALEIYQERNSKRRDLWKEYGWQDSVMHIRSKAARLANILDEGDPNSHLDDALDLINYSAFFVRNVREDEEEDVPREDWDPEPDTV